MCVCWKEMNIPTECIELKSVKVGKWDLRDSTYGGNNPFLSNPIVTNIKISRSSEGYHKLKVLQAFLAINIYKKTTWLLEWTWNRIYALSVFYLRKYFLRRYSLTEIWIVTVIRHWLWPHCDIYMHIIKMRKKPWMHFHNIIL